jgi:uncharacterized protein YggT (Ycf19 family)
MGPIDFILNLVGLLLWMNWRLSRIDPLAAPGETRRVGSLRRKRWQSIALLAGLVLLRALIYWQIGPAVNWTPKLDLGIVILGFRFRDDAFGLAVLYSVLSLVYTIVIAYFWLLAVALINRSSAPENIFERRLLLLAGRPARWPWPVQCLLPALAVAGLWAALHPLLSAAGILNRVQSIAHLVEQGLLVSLGVYFSLKYLLPAILLLHLVGMYVYLGDGSFWEFLGTTARNLLSPLRRIPLRWGRVDLTPLAGIVVILLLLHFLPVTVRNFLQQRDWTIWPT